MICLEIDNIAILSVKDIHYRCIIHDISKPCNLFVLNTYFLSRIIKILDIYKMHFKEVNVKNRVFKYVNEKYL